jgi:hypothetical protein
MSTAAEPSEAMTQHNPYTPVVEAAEPVALRQVSLDLLRVLQQQRGSTAFTNISHTVAAQQA